MKRKLLAYFALFFIIMTPVLLWLGFSNPQPGFSSFPDGIRALGQLFGILGANLFILNFIISARFRVVEDLLSGLNQVYFTHHTIGALALIFLLTHPILLALQFLPVSIEAVSAYLFPIITDYPVWFGILALTTLTVLLIITLYLTKLEYQKWRFTHQMLGVSLFLASMHIFLIPGNLTGNSYLRFYMLAFCLVALVTYVLRTLFAHFFIKHYPYKVVTVDFKGKDILEVGMKADGKKMAFLPGQFVFVEFVDSKVIRKEPHPFSISTPPGSDSLGFSVKSLGDFTETLKLLKPQSNVLIEGPYGRFFLMNNNKKQIWIAGGIGITPFLSMVRSFEPNSQYQVDLYYVTSTEKEAVYESELKNISKIIPQFKLHSVYTEKEGRLTAEKVCRDIPDCREREVYLCGPAGMMKSLRLQFRRLGSDNYRIHSEEFALR